MIYLEYDFKNKNEEKNHEQKRNTKMTFCMLQIKLGRRLNKTDVTSENQINHYNYVQHDTIKSLPNF